MLDKLKISPIYTNRGINTPYSFFQQVFSESIKLDVGLGYFSSVSFHILASGIARFISNGGSMNMYINQDITKKDYELFKKEGVKAFEESLLDSYEELHKTLSIYDRHFFDCLSYLIHNERINVKIVVPLDGGIAHEKYGIFEDANGNMVSFTGSLNLTGAAFLKNKETIDCTCSWKGEDSKEKIEAYRKQWQDVWQEKDSSVIVYDASCFCKTVQKDYPLKNVNQLIEDENDIIRKLKKRMHQESEKMDNNIGLLRGPHFPDSYSSGPLPYQVQAYKNWEDNNRQGIFAMATGTGKTVTALNCALERYKQNGYYHLIIIVPSKALVEQWHSEVKKFGFIDNIVLVGSMNPRWKTQLSNLRLQLQLAGSINYVIIVTYQSFHTEIFRPSLEQLSKNALLIADEMHAAGAPGTLPTFNNLKIEERIGLSATPNRAYDKDGTTQVAAVFGESDPPYTYEYTMREAINGTPRRLCPYEYYPRITRLNDEEMAHYVKITKQLSTLKRDESGAALNKELENKLLLKRKNIINKASEKITTFKSILDEIGEDKLKYTFVYCPEGSKDDGDYSAEEAKRLIEKFISETSQKFPSKHFAKYTGETSSAQRRILLDSFTDGEIDAIFAMKCLDEGVDVPRAEYGIFLASTGNPRQFIQRRGRLLRLHNEKERAVIYDIVVIPNFDSQNNEDSGFYNIERKFVRNELMRVAHFASLATNYWGENGIYNSLRAITNHYGISLEELIEEIES